MSSVPTSDIWSLEIPGIEILGPIGSGGMGEVYLARQVALDRLVAVKWLRLEDHPGRDPSLVERFRREARLMANLHHPNILTIHDFGIAQDRPYLVLEYVEGGDLRRLMEPGSVLPMSRTREIVKSVAAAVAFLHRKGILHRDLKPENILMFEGEIPKVADFGIAVLSDSVGSLTKTTARLGTPGYVAPEQHDGLAVDERADQYSLAALTYEMLAGQKPLGIFRPPSAHNAEVTPAVDAVLLKGLSESPADRYATVTEFADDLEKAFVQVSERRETSPKVSDRSLGPLVWVVGVVCVTALVGGLLAWMGNPKPMPVSFPHIHEPETISEESLIQLQAFQYWLEQGRPQGEQGAKAANRNREAAKASLGPTLQELANEIWIHRGAPKPADPVEAERGRIQDWEEAKRHLKGRLERRIEELEALLGPDPGEDATPTPADAPPAESTETTNEDDPMEAAAEGTHPHG